MKLNPDCLRAVLIAYEAIPPGKPCFRLNVPDFSEEEVFYHQQLLDDAGFIKLKYMATGDNPFGIMAIRLTYAGHEFLNASRNETNWNAVKDKMFKAGGFVIDLAKPLLIDLMKKEILGI